MKVRDPGLYRLMKNFLTVYLPDTKQKSPHTIQAYRDALNLYMGFLDSAKSVKLKDVCISGFVQRFMKTYEKKAQKINAGIPHRHPHL